MHDAVLERQRVSHRRAVLHARRRDRVPKALRCHAARYAGVVAAVVIVSVDDGSGGHLQPASARLTGNGACNMVEPYDDLVQCAGKGFWGGVQIRVYGAQREVRQDERHVSAPIEGAN